MKSVCLRRRGGVVELVGLRSGSTRSRSEGGVAVRISGAGEEVERGSLVFFLGWVSHGRVRGGIAGAMLGRIVLVYWSDPRGCCR